MTCDCPQTAGRTITDPQRHTEWHAAVVAAGGPAGRVTAATLRAARGIATESPLTETVVDQRARDSGRRASGERRRAAR